jgi:hypothetical protein
MEGSDVFAGSEIAGDDDPFAGTDFGDFDGGAEPQGDEAAQEAMAAGLKTVNKEGEEVDPGTGKPVEGDADPTPAAPAASAGPTEAAADPTPATPPSGAGSSSATGGESERDPNVPEQGETPAVETQPPPAPGPEPAIQTEPERPQEPAEQPAAPEPAPAAPPAAPEPAEEPAQTDGSSSEQPAEGDETQDADEGNEPLELKDEKNRVTHRAYHVLRALTVGKFERVFFHVDAEGKIVPKGTEGAKRRSTVLARSAQDALVHGYKAVGAPADGVMLVAVPHSHFQLKPVRPKPPEPSKTRLQIG